MSLLLENNPLREGLQRQRVADPCSFVIFGGTGDLAHRKLIPALFNLACHGLLPNGFAILILGRKQMSDEEFLSDMRKAVEDAGLLGGVTCTWDDFAQSFKYVVVDFTNADDYSRITEALRWADETRGTAGNRLFYLSIPPTGFEQAVCNLKYTGLVEDTDGWSRIVVEKPFGVDLASAQSLNEKLLDVFSEDDIFRVDHYLGKETVQNIQVFRFANAFLEPIWNHKYIDHVQITIAETIGVEERGDFYERTGALRDIIQNHALQLLTLVAMEPPASLDPDAIRDEKVKILKNVRRIPDDEVNDYAVRGQYGPGFFYGEPVPGYREESRVPPDSNVETFVALKLFVDNWRWAGVPFYIRTGKRLSRRTTEIAIQLKEVPDVLFKKLAPEQVEPNVIVLRVQPDEGITFKAESKAPGAALKLRPVQLDFRYGSSFVSPAPEAYERLLFDAASGDSSLFARKDSVEASWEIITPIQRVWQSEKADFPNYLPGTWGPQAALDLLAKSGRQWRKL